MGLKQVLTNKIEGEGSYNPSLRDWSSLIVAMSGDGSFSSVTDDDSNTGTQSVTLTGSNPTATFEEVLIEIVTDGAPETATFKVSSDSGSTYWEDDDGNQEFTTPADGVSFDTFYDIYGLKFTFSEDGETPADSYDTGDKFTFSTIKGLVADKVIKVTRDDYKLKGISGNLKKYLDTYFDTKPSSSLERPDEVYIVRPENNNSGSLTSVIVDGDNTGDGTLTHSGTPTRDLDVIVEIVLVGGACETAKYRFSIDGGDNWSDPELTPASGTSSYIGYGVSLTFTGDETDSWEIGDRFTFKATAPYSDDVLSVFDEDVNVMRKGKYFSRIYIAEEMDYDNWVEMSTILDDFEDLGFPMKADMAVKRITSGETVSTYIDTRIAEAEAFYDKRISLMYTYGRTQKNDLVNTGIFSTAMYSKIDRNIDVSKVDEFKLTNLVSIENEDTTEPYLSQLDNAGYTIVRTYATTTGYYFNAHNLLSESTSKYKFDRILRLAIAIEWLSKTFFTSKLGTDYRAKLSSLKNLSYDAENYIMENMEGEIQGIEFSITSTIDDFINSGSVTYNAVFNNTISLENVTVNIAPQN